MWLSLFIVSLILNLVGLIYIRWLLNNYKILWEDLGNISIMLADFSIHADNLHQLENYYGDEDIKNLIRHGKELVEKISEIDFVFEPEEDPPPIEAPPTRPGGQV